MSDNIMSNMTIVLRQAEQKDLDFILKSEENAENNKFIMPWHRDQHLIGMNDDKVKYFIVYHGNRKVGFVILAYDPDDISMEFKRLVITEKGQGFGRRTLSEIINYIFSSTDRKCIWLDVFKENIRAWSLYEKFNFRFIREQPYEDRVIKIYELLKEQD